MKKMKKLLIILVFVAGFSFQLNAQEGFFGGIHYAFNSTWLMNSQVFDDARMDVDVPHGSYWGLAVGYQVNYAVGFIAEFNFNTMSQKYYGDIDYLIGSEVNPYNAKTTLKTTEIPVLLKLGNVSYFEVGPVFQFLNSANYTRTFDQEVGSFPTGVYHENLYSFQNLDEENVKSYFAGNGVAIAMGFGSDIELANDALFLNIGVRFQYTLTDMEGINGLGLTKDSDYVPNEMKNRFKTNPLLGGIKLELKYKL